MKWLDKMLTPISEQEALEHVPVPDLEKLGGIDPPDRVTSADGELLATTDTEWDTSRGDFDLKYRLRIQAKSWDRTDIVCDGNALDVATTPLPDGRYMVKRILRGYAPAQIVEETEVSLFDHASTKDFVKWVEKQDFDTIEAFRQIYYDRWCFDTANQRDRTFYEILEEEKKGKV